MSLRVLLFLLGSLALGLLVYLQWPEQDPEFRRNNFLFFGLANMNIAIIGVLLFLIGRNVVKLIFDRRRGILGSRLRSRLVVAFVGVTLVPTAILFVLSSGLLNQALGGWFSEQVENSHRSALTVAQKHYSLLERMNRRLAGTIVEALPETTEEQRAYLEQTRKNNRLFALRLLDAQGKALVQVEHPASAIQEFQEPVPDEDAIRAAAKGRRSTLYEKSESAFFVRVYEPTKNKDYPCLLLSYRLAPELSTALTDLNASMSEYRQLKLFQNPIRSSYSLLLSMITGLILFSVIWFAFYLARELTNPIQRLAEATREVARGNLSVHVRATGDDELSFLVRSFNTMTHDLQTSRIENEKRRVFMETVLSHLVVAVIAIDEAGRISVTNDAAESLFEGAPDRVWLGLPWQRFVPEGLHGKVADLVEQTRSQENVLRDLAVELPVSFLRRGKEVQLVITAGPLLGADGKALGSILLFDDVTDIAHAQHMAAWREVARRIAHEIKNPLTPILLAAQRLQKKLGEDPGLREYRLAADTIVENVSSIKRLANEFSQYARNPQAELHPTNINDLISKVVLPLASSEEGIQFQCIGDPEIPPILLDEEQMRRVLMNILANAIDALRAENSDAGNSGSPNILIQTQLLREEEKLRIAISDDGPGVPDEWKAKIMQPYFTTKAKGTGLGLAIVSSIIAEHQGEIRIEDNTPRGSVFVIELPLTPKEAAGTQRHLVAQAR